MEDEAQTRRQINSLSQAVFTGQSQTEEMKVGTLLQIAHVDSLSIHNPPPSDNPKSNLLKQITAVDYLKQEEFYKTNKRPEFSHVVNLKGDDFPECSEYFRKDKPFFVGREKQLKALYDEIIDTGHEVIVGSPGIGKTTLALAYVHSYGTDTELYPGGVFWFEFNNPEPTEAAVLRRFAKYFSLANKKEEILLSQLPPAIKKLSDEGHRTLFVLNETQGYDKLEKYTNLFRPTHHHVIITSIYRDWGAYKSKPLQLNHFNNKEGIQFLKTHLIKNPEGKYGDSLIKKCEGFPQLLRKIVCYINESYEGSLEHYFKDQKPKQFTPIPRRKFKKLGSFNVKTQFPDIHRRELAATLTDILAKHHPAAFELLAIGVFLSSNCIAKELISKKEELSPDPIQILCKISLLEKVGKDHYKISYGIRSAIRSILELNQPYLGNSKCKIIKIEEAFNKALSIIEQKLPPIYMQNCVYDYSKYETYIPHAQMLVKAANKYKAKFGEIKKALPRVASLLLHSAYAYFRQGLLSEAEGMAKNGLDLAEEHYGKNTKEMITYYRLYGRILSKQNKLDIAEPILQQAIQVDLQNCNASELPQYELERGIAYGYLGLLLTKKGDIFYGDAEKYLKHADKMLEKFSSNPKLNNASQYYLALTQRHWGEHLSAKGEYLEAIKSYQSALDLCSTYFEGATKLNKSNPHEFKKYPFVTAIERRMATSYYSLGEYSKAEEKLNSVISILTELHGTTDHEEIVSSTAILAKILFWRGAYKEAQEKFDGIQNSVFAKVNPLNQSVIDTIYYQGRLLIASGQYLAARNKFVEALKQQQKHYTASKISSEREIEPNSNVIQTLKSLGFDDYQGINQLKTAKIIHYIGFASHKLGKSKIAENFYEEAVAINKEIGTKHPKAFLNDQGRASVTFQQGDYRKTEQILVDLLDRQEKFYKGNENTKNFQLGDTNRCLARLYIKTAQFEKATVHINAANKIWEELKQKEKCTLPEMVLTQITEGYLAWYAEHNYSKAKDLFTAALTEQEKLYHNQPHPYIAQTKARLGRINYFQGDYLGASQLYLEAKQIFEKCFKKDERKTHSLLGYLNYYIGEIYYQYWIYLDFFSHDSNYLNKAREMFHEAQKIFGIGHPETIPILCALSRIAIGTNDSASAYARLISAKTILENTFNEDVLNAHPQYAIILGNLSQINNLDKTIPHNYGLETTKMLENIYQSPFKIHPRIIEFFVNLFVLNNKSHDYRAKAITYFYARYFNEKIKVSDATQHFLGDFPSRNIEQISDIGLLINLQRILSCFGLEEPISALNPKVVQHIRDTLQQAVESPLFVEKPQQYIYVFCDPNDNAPTNHLEAAKQLGKLLMENNCGLIYEANNSALIRAVVAGVSESNGKIISIEGKYNTDYKNKMMASSLGTIVLPGGLNTLHKLTEILTNAQPVNYSNSLSRVTKPIGIFNIDKFYDGFFNLLQQSITCSYIKSNVLNLIAFYDDPSTLVQYIINFKPQASPILQAKLPNADSPIFLKEHTIDQNSDYQFTLLEATRIEVKNKLLTLKDDIKAREFLSEEICSALIAKKIVIDDNDFFSYLKSYYQHQTNLKQSLRTITNNSLTHIRGPELKDVESTISELNTLGLEDDLRELMNKHLEVSAAENNLKLSCQRPEIFQSYVDELGKQLPLGYKSALLYAQLASIKLYIWQKDSNHSDQLVLLTKHETSESQNVIHMLLIDGFTHFNRLSPVDPFVTSNEKLLGTKAEIILETRVPSFAWNTGQVLLALQSDTKNSKSQETLNWKDAEIISAVEERQIDPRNYSAIDPVQPINSEANEIHAFFFTP